MTKEHFNDYKQAIINCIESCKTPPQLQCCWDMLYRFRDVFTYIIPVADVNKAAMDIVSAYEKKESQLLIK